LADCNDPGGSTYGGWQLGPHFFTITGESREEAKEVEKLLILNVSNAVERVERGELARGTIRNPVKVIKQLFEVNDSININWRRIGCLLPMGRSYAMDGIPIMGEN
jgi:hypothetical protein